MKPRARRITIGATVLGAVVVAVLVVAHWGTVRDHVEAWHLQLTRDTMTIDPGSGISVVFDRKLQTHDGLLHSLLPGNPLKVMLRNLRESGLRVLEQRFPRKAFVVISDEPVDEEPLQSVRWKRFLKAHPDRPQEP